MIDPARTAVLLGRLRGGLIVSCQPDTASVFNTPDTIALFARCAETNGACAVRIEGAERIAVVRAAISIPIVGLIKRQYDGFEPYITTTLDEVAAIAAAGAQIVAFDATMRRRAGGATVSDLAIAAHNYGCLAMADAATSAGGRAAVESNSDIVSTTLAGYTFATKGRSLPALDLVAELTALHPFVVCEGGIGTAAQARAAFSAGASAIVVGTAITNIDVLVRRFAAATPRAPAS